MNSPRRSEQQRLKREIDRAVPKDIRIMVYVSSATLGAVGIYCVWIAGQIALTGEPVPAFIGIVVTAVVGGLVQTGKWALDILRANQGKTELEHKD